MKCPYTNCNEELKADDVFCTGCGQKVADAPPTNAAVTPPGPPPVRIDTFTPTVSNYPPFWGTYSAQITRRSPACLIFLVDQSGSMEEPIAGGGGQKKKDMVTDAINRLLYNTVLRCTKSEERPWPYFDIGVWTYGGNREVRRAFDSDLISISDVPAKLKRTETRKKREPDGAGGTYEEEIPFAIWIEPAAGGLTPMATAFRTIAGPVRTWIANNPDSFPPIILNLTDGAYSDENPAPAVWELMGMKTTDGQALVFNCHISQEPGQTLAFPSNDGAAGLTGLARELFEMSSAMPDVMRRLAGGKGYSLSPGSRGYVFNADIVTMIAFLDVGTQAVQDRMEVVSG